MKKFTKILSLALAMVAAVSVFSTSALAGNVRTAEFKRDLTQEEINALASVFNAEYYGKAYPDVLHFYGFDYYTSEADAILLNHFVNFGVWEERQPSAKFNVDVYATRSADLHKQYGSNIIAYYVYYAANQKDVWRGEATLADAYRRNVTIYSVYDFTVGQIGPNAGALPVQTENYAPNLGITGTDYASMRNRTFVLTGSYE